jgi:HK97 family phage prohead protease
MLLQHGGMGFTADDMTPIGVWTSLSEDGKGLRVEGKLADTARAKEIHALMKMEPRPAINGLSIGYYARKFTVGTKPTEPRRKLEEVELVEVSIVTNPANGKARVDAVKSIEESEDLREAEDYLRRSGSRVRSQVVSDEANAPRTAGC